MDNRPVIKIELDYFWFCPECNARNEEAIVPGTPDLTCQSCGANYKNGGVLTNCSTCKRAHYCNSGSPEAECTSSVHDYIYSERAAVALAKRKTEDTARIISTRSM